MTSIPKRVWLMVLLSLVLGGATRGQQPKAAPAKTSPLDYRVTKFELKDATFVEAVSQLSREPISGLHLGFEQILREKMTQAPPPSPEFSLLLKQTTVRQILDTICKYDSRYTWAQDGDTINVFPKELVGNETYLLNRRLDQISIASVPDPEQSLAFLNKQLPPPPEQLGYAGAGGGSRYAEPWSHTFSNLTVREFINRVSEHMGLHTSWVFAGAKQERFFTFVKGGFH